MTITRIGPSRYSATRSRIVIHQGVATTAVVSPDKSRSHYVQAGGPRGAGPASRGSGNKSRLLMVMVYVSDIGAKTEFNRAWDEWVDRENLPSRACVGAALEGDDLLSSSRQRLLSREDWGPHIGRPLDALSATDVLRAGDALERFL